MEDKIKELKEIIVKLKMELIKNQMPKGSCPYSKYKPSAEKKIDCTVGCEVCRNMFLKYMENRVRAKVEKL